MTSTLQNSAEPVVPKSALKTLVLTSLLAGTLDGLSAIIYFSLMGRGEPIQIAYYIASGVFGPEAFAGGTGMAIAGILFHYLIATIWTIVFFVMYKRLGKIAQNKILAGVLYGLFVWTIMNLIVVPASNVPMPKSFSVQNAIINAGILIVAIGLPISFMVNRHYGK